MDHGQKLSDGTGVGPNNAYADIKHLLLDMAMEQPLGEAWLALKQAIALL